MTERLLETHERVLLSSLGTILIVPNFYLAEIDW